MRALSRRTWPARPTVAMVRPHRMCLSTVRGAAYFPPAAAADSIVGAALLPLLWASSPDLDIRADQDLRQNCPVPCCTICISRAMLQISGGCSVYNCPAAVIETVDIAGAPMRAKPKSEVRSAAPGISAQDDASFENSPVCPSSANTRAFTRDCAYIHDSIAPRSLTLLP